MKFSTKAEYGLRAIIRLAKNKGKEPYPLARIAKEENISLAYLERLIAKLKRAGLVLSTKGLKGGYQLTKKPKEIKISEVLTALEGSLAPYYCLDINLCRERACSTKKVWLKLQEQIIKTLNSITLADLI
jgi:Rrf2 family protein